MPVPSGLGVGVVSSTAAAPSINGRCIASAASSPSARSWFGLFGVLVDAVVEAPGEVSAEVASGKQAGFASASGDVSRDSQ